MQPAKIKKQDFFNLVTRILPNYAIKRTVPACSAIATGCDRRRDGPNGQNGQDGQNAPGAARDVD